MVENVLESVFEKHQGLALFLAVLLFLIVLTIYAVVRHRHRLRDQIRADDQAVGQQYPSAETAAEQQNRKPRHRRE